MKLSPLASMDMGANFISVSLDIINNWPRTSNLLSLSSGLSKARVGCPAIHPDFAVYILIGAGDVNNHRLWIMSRAARVTEIFVFIVNFWFLMS